MSSICHCQVCTRGLNTSCTCLSLPSKLWFILPRCFFPSLMCRLLLSARKSQDKWSPLFPFFPLFCLHFYLYDSVFDTWALSSCVRRMKTISLLPFLLLALTDFLWIDVACGHVEAEYWCNNCNVLWLWGETLTFRFFRAIHLFRFTCRVLHSDRQELGEGRAIHLLNGIDILWCATIFSLLHRGRTMCLF